jgi:hypothetical protein
MSQNRWLIDDHGDHYITTDELCSTIPMAKANADSHTKRPGKQLPPI